jgi:predicted outer membrane repeat protein
MKSQQTRNPVHPLKAPVAVKPRSAAHVHIRERRRCSIASSEALEHRLLMSTWTLTNTADDGGAGTLRYAVMHSAAGDTIRFDPTVFAPGNPQIITLQESPISISHDLSIDGPGAAALSLSGGGQTAVFHVNAGADVALSGLTVTQGGSDPYADGVPVGIFNYGILSVGECNFVDDPTAVFSFDGALAMFDSTASNNGTALECDGSNVSIAGCSFSGNLHTAIVCQSGLVGGSVNISDCTFSHNSGDTGGAIRMLASLGPANIIGCIFNANSAADGGAVYTTGLASISNSVFSNNSAIGFGGGLAIDGQTNDISYCTFSGNTAATGGGIADAAPGNVDVIDTTISQNTAAIGGGTAVVSPGLYGGTFTLTDCTVSQNFATTEGGGISGGYSPPLLTVNNTIVAANTRTGGIPSDLAATVTGSYNLIGTGGSGGLTNGVSGNIVGASPLLAPLGDYGGPMETMALLAGSPAHKAGSILLSVDAAGNPLLFDQRGMARSSPNTDIGAYEAQRPKPPIALFAAAGADQISLNWLAGSNFGPYNVYRGTTPGGEGAVPIAIGLPSTTFVDTGLKAGTTYYYQVSSANAAGESARTNEAFAAPLVPPPISFSKPASTLTLIQDPDHLHIDWTMGNLIGQFPIDGPDGQSINGNGVIGLDYTNGDPLPESLRLNGTLTISGLSGNNPMGGTSLDIEQSTVYISYATGPDPLAAILLFLKIGYDAGDWEGVPSPTDGAIISSSAQSNPGYMIGYADSADGIVAGQPANTIELKYTLAGDLRLAGTVNFADFATVVSNYGKPAMWDTGAVTYGNSVSAADFALVVANYGKQAQTTTAAAVDVAANVNAASVAPTLGGNEDGAAKRHGLRVALPR